MSTKEERKRSLYFTAGYVPTEKERKEANELGITSFRNAAKFSDASHLERVDVVAGAVPERYRRMKGIKVVRQTKEAEEKKEG